MTKDEFYRDKVVERTEWWLHDPDLPECLAWARLRVFSDGTADACFEEGDTLHAFENREYASSILLEDEFRSVHSMDEVDEREFGIRVADLVPPTWTDPPGQAFKYWGTY